MLYQDKFCFYDAFTGILKENGIDVAARIAVENGFSSVEFCEFAQDDWVNALQDTAQAKRAKETGRKVDIHEKDAGYLDRCYEAALYAAEKRGWQVIPCFEGDGPRDMDLIFADILRLVEG